MYLQNFQGSWGDNTGAKKYQYPDLPNFPNFQEENQVPSSAYGKQREPGSFERRFFKIAYISQFLSISNQIWTRPWACISFCFVGCGYQHFSFFQYEIWVFSLSAD